MPIAALGVMLYGPPTAAAAAEKDAELYRIADLHQVWIMADVHGEDGEFSPGARAKVTIPQLGKTIEARVSANTPLFDPASRTLKLRLEAENPRLLLRPDMFVDVEFQVKAPAGLSVPAEAVLDSGMRRSFMWRRATECLSRIRWRSKTSMVIGWRSRKESRKATASWW